MKRFIFAIGSAASLASCNGQGQADDAAICQSLAQTYADAKIAIERPTHESGEQQGATIPLYRMARGLRPGAAWGVETNDVTRPGLDQEFDQLHSHLDAVERMIAAQSAGMSALQLMSAHGCEMPIDALANVPVTPEAPEPTVRLRAPQGDQTPRLPAAGE